MKDCNKKDCVNKSECPYPYYGLAPHRHNLEKTGGSFFGSTEYEPKETWPANFIPDDENAKCGVYEPPKNCEYYTPGEPTNEQ